MDFQNLINLNFVGGYFLKFRSSINLPWGHVIREVPHNIWANRFRFNGGSFRIYFDTIPGFIGGLFKIYLDTYSWVYWWFI